MRTLVVNNQKGGVGKTMLAVHATWFLAESARVLAVDLDPQGNASFSLSGAEPVAPSSALFEAAEIFTPASSPASISLFAADRRLDAVDSRLTDAVLCFRRRYAALQNAFDYAVIDTPPNWSGRNYAALMVATTLLAPIDLETYALQGVKQLLAQKQTVEKNARHGRHIDFLGLLPSRYLSTSPRQRTNLETLVRQDTRRLLFPEQCVITQRQGYAEALDLKKPVWTIRKTAAQEAGRELREVLGIIKTRLDSLPDAT